MQKLNKIFLFIRRQPLWRQIAAVVVLVLIAWLALRSGTGAGPQVPTFAARRGALEINVLEGGSLQALESQEVKCEVRVGNQGTKILKIVEEGYLVTEDDVKNKKELVELDSSELQKQIAQQELQYQQAVASLIKSWDPDFIITTGDNNGPNGEASNIDTNIGQFFHEFIYPYLGTFGAGAVSNRFFPSIGNHEWPFGVSGLARYLAYFTLPGNERYYSHRHGPVELFAVVSDQEEPDGATPTSVQARWLSNALATSTAPWRVVYFHECPYSSGQWHGSQTHQADNMLWPFPDWGADAIFAGHNHVYERVHTNGLNYTTIGLGGDRIDEFYAFPTPGSVARYNTTYGAGKLVVTETNLVFQFVNIFNQVIDSYTLVSGSTNLLAPDARRPAARFHRAVNGR